MIEAPVYDAFSAALVEVVEGLKVGDPLEPDTDLGPVSSHAHRDKVTAGTSRDAQQLAGSHPSGSTPSNQE